jgi:hypothetical protein
MKSILRIGVIFKTGAHDIIPGIFLMFILTPYIERYFSGAGAACGTA